MTCSQHSRNYSAPFGWTATFSWPLMWLRPARDMSLGRWLLVACFSSVKNHNFSGPHLFPSFTTCQKNAFATPRTVLQRAKKSLCNKSQFRTLFLPHRFIKIRPSHQRPVSIEFLTICRIPAYLQILLCFSSNPSNLVGKVFLCGRSWPQLQIRNEGTPPDFERFFLEKRSWKRFFTNVLIWGEMNPLHKHKIMSVGYQVKQISKSRLELTFRNVSLGK